MSSLAMRWPFYSINGAHVDNQKRIEPEPSSGLFSLHSKRFFFEKKVFTQMTDEGPTFAWRAIVLINGTAAEIACKLIQALLRTF
jgi:hypothetical protein